MMMMIEEHEQQKQNVLSCAPGRPVLLIVGAIEFQVVCLFVNII
jgi:hypothetical protein